MSFSSWRGVVGMINPTMRPGMTEEVIRLLPEGIGLIPLFLNIRRGTEDEFETMMPHYEKLVALLAEQAATSSIRTARRRSWCRASRGEAEDRRGAGRRSTRPRSCSVAQNHVRALKAVKAKSIVGATYFPEKLNAIFAKYFSDAGFTVRGMDGIDVPFDKVQELSGEQVYAHIKTQFPQSQGRRRDLHARLRLAHARHHRDLWSRTCRCRWCIRSPRGSGRSRSGCMCASRGSGFGYLLAALP